MEHYPPLSVLMHMEMSPSFDIRGYHKSERGYLRTKMALIVVLCQYSNMVQIEIHLYWPELSVFLHFIIDIKRFDCNFIQMIYKLFYDK